MAHPTNHVRYTALLILAFLLVLGVTRESLATQLPPPATITVPGTDTDGNYVVKWTKPATTATGIVYVLQEATNSAFIGARTLPNTTFLSASISGRSTGKVYYYRVRAQKTGWTTSAWKKSLITCSVMIPAGTPGSITVPKNDVDGSYNVSWTASATTGVSYVLQEATNSAFTGARTVPQSSLLSANVTGRTVGQTYYYRVRAEKTGYRNSSWKTTATGCLIGNINPESQKYLSVSSNIKIGTITTSDVSVTNYSVDLILYTDHSWSMKIKRTIGSSSNFYTDTYNYNGNDWYAINGNTITGYGPIGGSRSSLETSLTDREFFLTTTKSGDRSVEFLYVRDAGINDLLFTVDNGCAEIIMGLSQPSGKADFGVNKTNECSAYLTVY